MVNVTAQEVARPLNMLATLIKKKLTEAQTAAREAAEAAEQPYWAEIGELMREAKEQFNSAAEFYQWSQRQFGISDRQTRRYVEAVTSAPIGRRASSDTLSDALRSIGKAPRGHHGISSARQWVSPVDDIAERARREAERIREAELTRQQEREAQRQLAMRLIDIGYRVLAKELHPDAGGSKDAMARLHLVRDRLKAHA